MSEEVRDLTESSADPRSGSTMWNVGEAQQKMSGWARFKMWLASLAEFVTGRSAR